MSIKIFYVEIETNKIICYLKNKVDGKISRDG